MTTNLERYRKDLDDLITKGELLEMTMEAESLPSDFRKAFGDETDAILAKLPSFGTTYQAWYSEGKAVIRQLLPDRLADFVRLYEKPKPRKEITYENYCIEDYLQGLTMTRSNGLEKRKVVGPEAAIPRFRQQLSIVKATKGRFESSLFDIRQLVQADLFDSELEAAAALAKNGFFRASGAVAGVVLEKHLVQVCTNHSLKLSKKAPTIADCNDALKAADVIDTATWRFIQHLADIRNLCDHTKAADPTPDQVNDLIKGVSKLLKTLF